MMDEATKRLLDSLTDEQIRQIRKMMNAIIPIFKVFAGALMEVLDEDQKVLLAQIVEEAERR